MRLRIAGMIADKYGGKKALLIHIAYKILYAFGLFKPYTMLDWKNVDRLVFICMGNINRSPYAEFKAKQMKLASISYGIDADETKGASIVAIRNAASRNIDIHLHVCKSIYNLDIREGDLLVGLEPKHMHAIHKKNRQVNFQQTLLGLWCSEPMPYIQDPIGRSDKYYQSCFSSIDNGINGLQKNILNQHLKIFL